ncbi:MAG: DedA family protein [Bacteroidetes bacterium]|nr:DedA family protein [Bacteroidota bacterium]
MEFIQYLIDLVLHLDVHLNELILMFGVWTYAILFLIIFAETGLVITPFLPGDSLLFALGALAAGGAFHLETLMILLTIASIAGDTTNYSIGNYLGPKVFHFENSRFFNKDYLMKTHGFYEKHGGKTIILAKFLPIFRTFAPFVAGIGSMTYPKFIMFNVIGGLVWINGFLLLGFFFGNIPFVKENFGVVILAIIFISILPAVYQVVKAKMAK